MPEPTAEDRERAEKIVAADSYDTIELIAQALADKRERCAKVAETTYSDPEWAAWFKNAGDAIAARIRALGQTTKERE